MIFSYSEQFSRLFFSVDDDFYFHMPIKIKVTLDDNSFLLCMLFYLHLVMMELCFIYFLQLYLDVDLIATGKTVFIHP